MPISFCKFHGFGNDYIVFESENLKDAGPLSDFSRMVCHRNTGIGGDGIAVLEKLEGSDADFSCRIINPDGSEAGFSGNGTRCAAAYLYYKGIWGQPLLRLKTISGVKAYEFLSRSGNEFTFRAGLGKPLFTSGQIPFREDFEAVVDFPVLIDGAEIKLMALNVGNPVAAIFVDGFSLDWRSIGRSLENHYLFPERTNVVFIKIRDEANIEIRIWERGAGETSSSGTCSIAAAIASAYAGKASRKISVHAEGGTTKTEWREDDEMLIEGSADLAFCGKWMAH